MTKRKRGRPAPVSLMGKALADKLVKLHAEHGSVGPLLFGIRHHREIAECADKPDTIAEAAFGRGSSYGREIYKGIKLATLVVER